jgi:hypothetical protein
VRPGCARRMGTWAWLSVGIGAFVLLYALFVLALLVAGRRENARALAGFVPDCAILCSRLLRDPRVPRRRKALFVALAGYLAFPVDVVPDFIPVAGQLDDADRRRRPPQPSPSRRRGARPRALARPGKLPRARPPARRLKALAFRILRGPP